MLFVEIVARDGNCETFPLKYWREFYCLFKKTALLLLSTYVNFAFGGGGGGGGGGFYLNLVLKLCDFKLNY
jgi:hypothetical protein